MQRAAVLVFAVLCAAALPAFAQDEFTLIDGSVLKGAMERVEAGKIVFRDASSGALLEIPLRYLSPFQQYRVRTWNVKPDAWTPEYHVQLLEWSLDYMRYDERLKEAANAQLKMALDKGYNRKDLDERLAKHGYMIGEQGALTTPEERGLKWDSKNKEWVTPEELEKREKEAKAAAAEGLKKKFIIGNPSQYDRVSPSDVLEARNDFKKRKIRFWAHFYGRRDSVGSVKIDGGASLGDDKFIGLALFDEDFAFAFIEKSNKKLADKLDVLLFKERVQVFGTVELSDAGFVLRVDDIVAE